MALNAATGLISLARDVCVDQLLHIINTTRTDVRPLPGFEGLSIGFDRSAVGVDCDEVFPKLLIGDAASATSMSYLQHSGVTHIVNAAEGNIPGMMATGVNYYARCGIIYMGLPIFDDPYYNITIHFNVVAQFIDHAIKHGGKVLIHCFSGRSRSATLAVAYLMLIVRMPLCVALRTCCRSRSIKPNEGFLQQLCHLDACLRDKVALPL